MKTATKTTAFLLLVFVLFGLMAGCMPTPTPTPVKNDLLSRILARGTIVVATDPAYPPQSELIPGAKRVENTKCSSNEYTSSELTGYDIDTAMEVAKRLGVEACFVTPAWGEIVAGGWSGRWDISIGSMAITRERLKVLYFIQPYAAGQNVLYVHKDNKTYQKLSDLSGKKIGVCAGCVNEEYLNQTMDIPGLVVDFVIKDAEIVGYDADLSALQDLSQGDGTLLDAVLTDQETGDQAIKDGFPIRQMPDPAFSSYSAMATDQKSQADSLGLAARVTEIVKEMLADGTLTAFSKKYYNGTDYASAASSFDIHELGQLP